MKMYNKPAIQVVELKVKESLSGLPARFGGTVTMGKLTGATYNNVSIYTKVSTVADQNVES